MHTEPFGITYWVLLSTAVQLGSFTAVALHALKRRRNASATLLWIFVAWSFPLIGPLIYLGFGIDRVPARGLRTRAAAREILREHREKCGGETPKIPWHTAMQIQTDSLDEGLLKRLCRSIDALNPEHPLVAGNRIDPLVGGDGCYPEMLSAIRSARHHIHLQSFILRNDAVGYEFMDALKARAEAGVQVRVLFDRFGSTHAYLGGMFRQYRNIPNFAIQGWTQANPLKRQFQINLRNHRKNLIIDGAVAFFGGVNLSKENRTRPKHPAIRDYHFKVKGPLVQELQFSFLRDWFFMNGESLDQLLQPAYFPAQPSAGEVVARVIDSGPSASADLAAETFFNAITMAQNRLLIATPYFAPTTDILRALRSAARRGVEVDLVVPRENNHRYAGLAAQALYEELLESGVRIHERQPPFMHAKAMLIDDSIALVGTANLDVRSLELNYETIVLISGGSVIDRLKRIVHEDLAASEERNLNEWLQRPSRQKLAENLSSLMTPVL